LSDQGQDVFLYEINVKDNQFDAGVFYEKIIDDNVKIGFISTTCIEEDPPEFNLYKSNNLFNISVKRVNTLKNLRLTEEQIEVLKRLQTSIYNDLLNLKAKLNFDSYLYGICIVFLTHDKQSQANASLDWDLMMKLDFEKLTLYQGLMQDPQFVDEIARTKRVVKFKPNKRRLFTVKEICPYTKASSPFPRQANPLEKPKSFADYFDEKYPNCATLDEVMEQPLVELTAFDLNLNFLLKTSNFKKDKSSEIKQRKYQECFIIDHVFYLPFSQAQTCTLNMVPTIIHRVDSLLKASKLKNQIERQIVSDLNIVNPIVSRLNWEKSIKFHVIKKGFVKSVTEIMDDSNTNVNLNLNTNLNSNINLHLSSNLDSTLSINATSKEDDAESEADAESDTGESESSSEESDLPLICSAKKQSEEKVAVELKKKEKLVAPDLFIEEGLFSSEITDLSENSKFNFPNAYNVLQCLTLKSANDNFDLERYEILGVTKQLKLENE
jgi:hypothetical protein